MIDDSDFIFAQSLREKKCFCWCHTNTLGTILRRFPQGRVWRYFELSDPISLVMLCLCLKQSAQSERVVICNSKTLYEKIKNSPLATSVCQVEQGLAAGPLWADSARAANSKTVARENQKIYNLGSLSASFLMAGWLKWSWNICELTKQAQAGGEGAGKSKIRKVSTGKPIIQPN